MNQRSTQRSHHTAGMDVGNRSCHICWLDEAGQCIEEVRIRTREADLRRWWTARKPMRVAIEVGSHSPWLSRLLAELGHEVIVANARKLRLIYENRRKSDRVDARYLARLARVDPQLLHPIQHRGPQAQADLAVIRVRANLVQIRTQLINQCRGMVWSVGERLPRCSARAFGRQVAGKLPEPLAPALGPVVAMVHELTDTIRAYDRQIEQMAQQRYPETELLQAVGGVGALTAVTFVLTLEAPERFANSRAVGAYLGMVPRQSDSGDRRRPLSISKEGDRYLRTLLTQCAHHILGPFGKDCELRRFGQRLLERAGTSSAAKRRAVIAVARKLACLLHHLWITGEVYDPEVRTSRAA